MGTLRLDVMRMAAILGLSLALVGCGQSKAPPTKTTAAVLITREAHPNQFSVAVDDNAAPTEFVGIARKTCANRSTCQVDIWEVNSDGESAAHRFDYVLDKSKSATETTRWDCTRYPSTPKDKCLPPTKGPTGKPL
jgi:hypothetical protein